MWRPPCRERGRLERAPALILMHPVLYTERKVRQDERLSTLFALSKTRHSPRPRLMAGPLRQVGGSVRSVSFQRGLLHSRCSLRDKGEVKLLKLLGVQTSSLAAAVTLSRAVPPDWILTRPPRVTACRDRHFAPRVKQTLSRWLPTEGIPTNQI
jgi:hypothetical protein